MSEKTTLGGWLVHIMREVDGALSLEEAFHVLMDSFVKYFPCQSVAVILIDQDTDEVRIKISRQISYTFIKQFRKSAPTPTIERVVLEQHSLLLNAVNPEDNVYQEIKLEHDFSSAVVAPIINNKRGVGYIFCDRANGENFNEADLLHLQVLGYISGSLIEKYELIQVTRKLSQIDDASKALQYKAFVSALAKELERAQTHDYQVALALVSVDAFRRYLDTYGINEAHLLLEAVCKETHKLVRDIDTLARFGADQFILYLSGVTDTEAYEKIEEIKAAVQKNIIAKCDIPITLTVGTLILHSKKELSQTIQSIIATLGKKLVEAKAEALR